MDSATQELAFLRKVIQDSRQSVVDNGLIYIVWGIVVTIGVGSIYVEALLNEWRFSMWIWGVGISTGIVYSIIQGRKEMREPVQTFAGKILGTLWASTGLSMMIVGVLGSGLRSIPPMAISPLMCAFLAIAYSLSGVIYDLKWFRNLAYGWWASAIVLFAWHSIHALGLYVLLMIVLQIVPGILLYRRSKQLTSTGSLAH